MRIEKDAKETQTDILGKSGARRSRNMNSHTLQASGSVWCFSIEPARRALARPASKSPTLHQIDIDNFFSQCVYVFTAHLRNQRGMLIAEPM